MKFFLAAKTLARYWRMAQDPRTPAVVRYLIYGGIAYTVSPIDLLPDWFPGLGLLDDAAVVPSVIALAMLLIPKEVKESYEKDADSKRIAQKIEGKKQAHQGEGTAVSGPEPTPPTVPAGKAP